MNSLLIYIPTFNAQETITSVIKRIPPSILREHEILIVDDASTDSTVETIKNFHQENKELNLKIIKHQKNVGYGGSQKTAYQYALSAKVDFVLMLHGDGQYAPEEMTNMLEKILSSNHAMIFGSRITGSPLKGGMPLYRYLSNRILTTIQNQLLDVNLSEFHSGYRLYRCSALKNISFLKNSDHFHFDTQIILQLIEANYTISEVPTPTYYGEGSRSISFKNCCIYGLNVLKFSILFFINRRQTERKKE